MTCSQPKMPIDINMNNFKGECKNCEFTYNYQDSTCTAKNKGDVIELSYDVLTRPSAYFNKISLDVEKVLLYSPSLHKYEGVHEDGELIIYHKGINTKLMACIPINTIRTIKVLLMSVSDIFTKLKLGTMFTFTK